MGWVLLALLIWLGGEVDNELNWMARVVAKGATKLILYVATLIAFMHVIA